MPLVRLLAIAAMAVTAACSKSSTGYGGNPPPAPPPPPPPGGNSTTITLTNNAFSPSQDTISAGTINFQWSASVGSVLHNVTWLTAPGAKPADSGDMSANGSYQATLATGDYTYHCTHHPGMDGAIHVSP
jgi:plastocyanin